MWPRIDNIIKEPMGGAHRDGDEMAETIKATLVEQLNELQQVPTDELLERRYEKLMSFGTFQ